MSPVLEDRLKEMLALSEKDLQDLRDKFLSIPLPTLQYAHMGRTERHYLGREHSRQAIWSSRQQREYEIFGFCLTQRYE
jgi:hypothetical protein